MHEEVGERCIKFVHLWVQLWALSREQRTNENPHTDVVVDVCKKGTGLKLLVYS